MSTVKTRRLQIGISATSAENFSIVNDQTKSLILFAKGNTEAPTSNIFVANTATSTINFEDNTISRAITRDMGSVYVDRGTQSTGTITFDYSAGNLQRLQVGGALTLAFSNFPPTANMGVIQIELVNGGSSTVTFPTINWVKKDGTFTTSITTYLSDFGRTTLQTSGTDFFVLWTRDAGTTLYGKLL